jgi:NAD(P)-dependent dehydrogenase (short-subunit alcohol dehydrogenase family)
MQISGSVALVTGANRGLGRVYTRELIRRGAQPSPAPMAVPASVTSTARQSGRSARIYDDVESPVGQR